MTQNADLQNTLKAVLEAQVLQALKTAPEAIEAMVKAALSLPVDPHSGRPDGHSYNKIPYLEWITGATIRDAVRDITVRLIKEQEPLIEAELRKHITAEEMVKGFTQTMLKAAGDSWNVKVTFGKKDD